MNNPSELKVLKSAAGYYIGRTDSQGFPYSRNSVEYWENKSEAEIALQKNNFTLRDWV